jgi:hypothetical protein
LYPGEYICLLGLDDLKIRWIKEGTFFKIDEYDGSESFEYCQDIEWNMASVLFFLNFKHVKF